MCIYRQAQYCRNTTLIGGQALDEKKSCGTYKKKVCSYKIMAQIFVASNFLESRMPHA